MTVARSFPDSDAVRYVLPVLQMTSCCHTMGPTSRIKPDVMFRRVRQVAVPDGRQTTTVFGFVRQNVADVISLSLSDKFNQTLVV